MQLQSLEPSKNWLTELADEMPRVLAISRTEDINLRLSAHLETWPRHCPSQAFATYTVNGGPDTPQFIGVDKPTKSNWFVVGPAYKRSF